MNEPEDTSAPRPDGDAGGPDETPGDDLYEHAPPEPDDDGSDDEFDDVSDHVSGDFDGTLDADDDETARGDVRMSLGEHLEELRKRILRAMIGLALGMIVGLVFGRELLRILEQPYFDAMEQIGHKARLVTDGHAVGFAVYFRVSLMTGMILAAPWIFYQVWQFIAVGLYPKERRYVHYSLPFTAGLFVCGAMFFLLLLSTPFLVTLNRFNLWVGAEPYIQLATHVSFMTNMMLVFGLAFQTPLAVLLLAKVGLVSIATLNHFRRHVVVVILIVAAVLTPPDPFSQIALAVPMWLLYELGVLLAWLLVARKQRKAEQEG